MKAIHITMNKSSRQLWKIPCPLMRQNRSCSKALRSQPRKNPNTRCFFVPPKNRQHIRNKTAYPHASLNRSNRTVIKPIQTVYQTCLTRLCGLKRTIRVIRSPCNKTLIISRNHPILILVHMVPGACVRVKQQGFAFDRLKWKM